MAATQVDQAALAERIDNLEICELIRLERFWRDQGDWDRLAAAFTDDSRVRTTWFNGSGAEFAAASREMAEEIGVHSTHLITPTHVRVNGDRGLVDSLGEIHIRTTIDGVEVDMLMECRFFSRVRRTRDGWRLASFDGIYHRDVLKPVNPAERLPVDWDELQALRPSYRSLAYVLTSRGYEVTPVELGTDRPDLLEPFYRAAEEWLESGE